MDKVQSDLVLWYKLETEFFRDHVRHTKYAGKAINRNEKVTEDWRNCEELGRGGFGIVHKQIQKTTGHYRAVKAIDKRLPAKIDYSRELLVMAILAKRPSLFVEFLGWFEEPETLYIAMEYFKGGDLTKHTGMPLLRETVQSISKQILEGLNVMHQQGIAHRDLKPANIFVVSMSPIWVKLGDFGVSKRILAEATTTFHTQVSTQVYSAPEVLGLDSNSETSNYTNSVDIWSLGCVIYELLAGAKLFVSETQVSRYYFGKWPFPEDTLKALSSPTGDAGISFLKSMLLIQPEDRPTAARALRHVWLAGLKSDTEDSGDDQDQKAQDMDKSIPTRKRENRLATHDEPKKRRNKRNSLTQNTCYMPGGVGFGADPGSRRGGSLTSKTTIDTPVTTLSDATSAESSVGHTGARKPELIPYNFPATHPKSRKARRKKRTRRVLQTCPQDHSQAIPQGQTLTVEIVFNPPQAQIPRQNTRQREHTNLPPRPSMNIRQELHTDKPTISRRTGSGKTHQNIPKTKLSTRERWDGRNLDVTTANSMQNPNTRRNPNLGQDPRVEQTPNASWNPNQSPNAGYDSNIGGNPNLGRKANLGRNLNS